MTARLYNIIKTLCHFSRIWHFLRISCFISFSRVIYLPDSLLKDPRIPPPRDIMWWVFRAPALFGFDGDAGAPIINPFHPPHSFKKQFWKKRTACCSCVFFTKLAWPPFTGINRFCGVHNPGLSPHLMPCKEGVVIPGWNGCKAARRTRGVDPFWKLYCFAFCLFLRFFSTFFFLSKKQLSAKDPEEAEVRIHPKTRHSLFKPGYTLNLLHC